MTQVVGNSMGSYISYGWKHAKARIRQHRLPLVVIALVVSLLSLVSGTVGSFATGEVDMLGDPMRGLNAIGVLVQVVLSLFGLWYGIGMIKMGLYGADEKPFSFRIMFDHSRSVLWKYVATVLLFALLLMVPLMVIRGLIYLASTAGEMIGLVVGIVVGLAGLIYLVHMIFRISFVLYYVVVDHADELGPVAMIKHAWHMTKGNVWKLFGVSFVAGLTNILGFLALGVGLLWTIPLTEIATAKLYRDLDDAYHKKHANKIA